MIKSYDLYTNKNKLWDIYRRCTRSEDYYNLNVASTTNVFIDNPEDCEYIEQNIVEPLGIDIQWLNNQYDDSVGYNFNVVIKHYNPLQPIHIFTKSTINLS